jgi:pimeloyl-ACP methyl ester carboxylesterase
MKTHSFSIDSSVIEYRWTKRNGAALPKLIFLHEGLGCVSHWRDFPDQLAEMTGTEALIYSRTGYGRSSPVDLPRPVDFMDTEAKILEKLLAAFNIGDFILIGHSDGASIALIFAGGGVHYGRLHGLVLEAPHVFVEQRCVESIRDITEKYRSTDLADRLRRHHGENTDCAFLGWSGVWLDPAFVSWNIEKYLSAVTVPTLLLQGDDDEYGSMRQIDAIKRNITGSLEVMNIAQCGHSPHREQREVTLKAMSTFITSIVG